MPTRFYRTRNRTVVDIFKKQLMPRAEAILYEVVQKIAQYSVKHHRWVNRTGALEKSISFVHPKMNARGTWQAEVFAGGWSEAKYAFNYGRRKQRKQNRRNYRYQRGLRFAVGKGMGLYVNYAWYVEKKGFPVLSQGIVHYQPLIRRRLHTELSAVRICA